MCEHFNQIEGNSSLEKKIDLVSSDKVNKDHIHIQEKIKSIHSQETRLQISDFLKTNPPARKNRNLDESVLIDAVVNYTNEMKELDLDYNIWDDESLEVDSVIDTYLENNNITHQIEAIKKEKQTALNLEQVVIQEQKTGKSNLQIIQSIINQQAEGVISIPKHKIDQYQKILALSNQTANTPDQKYIQEIINSSETDLLDEGSFENIIFQVYDDERISSKTKELIEQQFKVKSIHTGNDLKRALEGRNGLILQHDNQLNKLNDELLLLDKKEESLQHQLDTLKAQIESTTDLQKREKIYQEIYQIEKQVKSLQDEKEQTIIESNTLKQQKPNDKVTLRGYDAKLKQGIITIKNPIDGNSVRIPIQADNEKIGMIANSLFLRQIIEPIGGEHLVFPNEKFQENDLPTFTMLPFSNGILAALHLGGSGEILTKSELKILDNQFKRLQNPNNLTYLKSPEEGMKEDFKALGLLDGSVLIKNKFLNLLESLHAQPNLKLF